MIISGCFRGEDGGRRRVETEIKVELENCLLLRKRDSSSALDLKEISHAYETSTALDHRHISEKHSSLGGTMFWGIHPRKPKNRSQELCPRSESVRQKKNRMLKVQPFRF